MRTQRAATLLALLDLPRVGPKTVWDALTREGATLESAAAAVAARVPGGAARLAAALPARAAAVARAQDLGLEVLTVLGPGYPAVLAFGPLPPPPVLFVRGRLPRRLRADHVNELASVGVVGTRSATSAGLQEARALGAALADAGAVVVSGLALGIDGAAHRGALDAARRNAGTAPTVAVLGGAHDRLHPQAHARLAEAIVAAGGAVISEHPPGTSPQPASFLRRNRIIAALSHVLVVVEAGARSGALDTVDHAGRLGRDVLTIPARPSDRRRAGNLALLRGKAKVLVDLTDLAVHLASVERVAAALTAMAATGAPLVPAPGAPPLPVPAADDGSALEAAGPASASPRAATGPGALAEPSPAGPGAAATATPPSPRRGSLPPVGYGCLRVLAALARGGDASFDGLLARLTRSGARRRPTPAELAGCLVRLELAGCLVRADDGRYRAA